MSLKENNIVYIVLYKGAKKHSILQFVLLVKIKLYAGFLTALIKEAVWAHRTEMVSIGPENLGFSETWQGRDGIHRL